MRKKIALGSVLALLFLSGAGFTTSATAGEQSLQAVAEMNPTQGNNVRGIVTFREMGGMIHVTADLTGLPPGKHGFHIHEKGDCSAPDASSAGGHFNPANAPHGNPHAGPHHAGDFGNLEADKSGKAHFETMFDDITLTDGPNSIIGRAVIVHANEDDLKTQPTGNAGARLACGVIKRK